jgi:hypothetical protein
MASRGRSPGPSWVPWARMRGLSIALAMTATEAQAFIKYVTNAEGQTTDVLVPLSVWEALLEGVALEDPDAEAIAASIERGLRDIKAERTKPIAELWASLDAE